MLSRTSDNVQIRCSKYQGNVREEENNDNPGKGCSLFRNELTTKEVFDAFNTTTI